MGQVTVTINERQYRIGCEDGQEDHLRELGGELDRRTTVLREQFGEIGDARLSIMAAVMLLDELAEARTRLHRLEQEMTRLRQGHSADAQRLQQVEVALAAALDAAAARIDGLSRQLNSWSDHGSSVAMG